MEDNMKVLIYGAGTIGLTYGWMLSNAHDIAVLVRGEKYEAATAGYSFDIWDLRGKAKERKSFQYIPSIVTNMEPIYDLILVTVNCYQLKEILPILKEKKGKAIIVFLQNNWDILGTVRNYFNDNDYVLGFPAQVGGGRENNCIKSIIFDAETILGQTENYIAEEILTCKSEFEKAGIKIVLQEKMADWLRVHIIQQSISAGAIIKAGNYELFIKNRKAIKEMIIAYREGLAVCDSFGISTRKMSPAKMFYYPTIVTFALKKILNQEETIMMVNGHMKHGITEWIKGYYEILECGIRRNIEMLTWESYASFIDDYLK